MKLKKVKKKIKAIAMFSGGLDSMLAVKLVQEQNIKVIGFHAISPLFPKNVEQEAKQLKIKVIEIDMGSEKNISDFINMIRNPRFGYGTAINPCIDCKMLMLKKAKELNIGEILTISTEESDNILKANVYYQK